IQGDLILEVFNMSGTMVKSEILKAGRSVYQIDTGTLNRGVYIFRLKNNGTAEDTTRIMIMK
ncbi:MAG: T9SS type A sorting domain-containing protein, partial [Bacteroidales bacterium]